MGGRAQRAAWALVLVASAVAAVGLGLEALGHGSTAVAAGFAVVAVAAGGACLAAAVHGGKRGPRLALVPLGFVLPAFAAFALAPALDRGGWALALDGAGVGGVAVAVLAVFRRRR